MADQYSLIVQNNSTNLGDACVYQTDPDLSSSNAMSLAWFSKTSHPTTKQIFTWTIDYSFVWAQTGELKEGVMFVAGQAWPADLSKTNQVSLSYLGGAYTFKDQTSGPKTGNLYIAEDPSVPLKKAAVGIGMSGSGTFAVQAQPNYNLIFTPHPKYWITFGTFTQGQVLDIGQMTNSAEISFDPGVTSMTAVLNKDNTWTIQSTDIVNENYIQAKKTNSLVKWGSH